MGVRRGIDRKKVGCRSLIDANLEGQVGVNKFKLYILTTLLLLYCVLLELGHYFLYSYLFVLTFTIDSSPTVDIDHL